MTIKKAKKIQTRNGFTLIELLVVISIISFLSCIILAAVNGARVRARDAERISNVKQFQNALELYYDSNGQKYPQPALATPGATLGGSYSACQQSDQYYGFSPGTYYPPELNYCYALAQVANSGGPLLGLQNATSTYDSCYNENLSGVLGPDQQKYISQTPTDPLYSPDSNQFAYCYVYVPDYSCEPKIEGSTVYPYVLIFSSEVTKFNLDHWDTVDYDPAQYNVWCVHP